MTARCVALDDGADAAGFKAAVRWLVAGDVPPADVVWSVGAPKPQTLPTRTGELEYFRVGSRVR